jgi:two-component system sensor histidine kinase/response regulator
VSEALGRLDDRFAEAADARMQMRLRAETAGRFREEFVAAVRHELNTPLNAILGFTEVLLQEVDGPLTPQQREDVEAIRSAGAYLQELVEAVLAEWAPDRNTPMPVMPVDLPVLAREVARLLEGQVPDDRVALRVEVVGDPPKPAADARRIRQVLINLGTNAIRATSRGSVTFEVAPHEEGVRLTVRDTGAGIPPERIPHLFEEFEQVGDAQANRGGSGLGLALTRDLVEWHGGRIEVASEPGAGSAFHVLLPEELE